MQYLPYATNERSGLHQSSAVTVMDVNNDPTYTGSPHQLFYQSSGDNIADDNRPFSEIIYEPSPLNRVQEQYGAGEGWYANTKNVSISYETNTESEVHLWVIEDEYPVFKAGEEHYEEGELYKNVTTDEEGHQVQEFVDKLGRTILKRVEAPINGDGDLTNDWADTYYVYDDFGNLRFVLPPEATIALTK
jgi:hypothetical protein